VFAKALSRQTFRAIEALGKAKILPQAYLAGGTALALHLGHRESEDLDFFTDKAFNEAILIEKLKRLGEFKVKESAWRTILGRFMKVKFSIFYYQYPLLEQTVSFKSIKIASKKDIAAMKLQAIGDRGAKRDFIDLFFLCKELTLEAVFDLYGEKFDKLEERKYHLLRGLRYFEDAERDLLPVMYQPIDWEEVKQFFRQEVKRLAKKWQLV
jgi:predicted nucleotidyltransferase component of viral defense system